MVFTILTNIINPFKAFYEALITINDNTKSLINYHRYHRIHKYHVFI